MDLDVNRRFCRVDRLSALREEKKVIDIVFCIQCISDLPNVMPPWPQPRTMLESYVTSSNMTQLQRCVWLFSSR